MSKKRVRPTGLLDDSLGEGGRAAFAPAPILAKPTKAKKTSKRSEITQQFATADGCRSNTSKWLTATTTDMQARHGDLSVQMSNKAYELVRGIPLPYLCLEYLYGTNMFPLGGRVSQFVGKEGSCKTGLAIEHGSWFIDAGGIVVYREHESKYSPVWTSSIIGWDRGDSFQVVRCPSINAYQASLLDMPKRVKEFMRGSPPKSPGPGAVFPVLDIVDSVMGKLTESSQDKILADGSAGPAHAIEALSLTRFLSTYLAQVEKWPYHLILINHLKMGTDDNGMEIRKKAGGANKDFLETFEVQSSRIGKIKLAGCDGIKLRLETYKNSLGTGSRSIEVDVRWWEEDAPDATGGYRQKTVWDWDTSTVLMLAGAAKLPDTTMTRIREVLDLNLNKTQHTAYSKRLGIKKDNPLSYSEVSKLLHADRELVMQLRRVLGINIYNEFVPGMDYREQLLGSKTAAALDYKLERARADKKNEKKKRYK